MSSLRSSTSRRWSRPQRVYSIDEVKRSARIRDTVRRVDIGDVTFDTGEATVERDQVGSLTKVASAMTAADRREPVRGVPHRGPHRRGRLGRVQPRAVGPAGGDDRQPPDDLYNIPPENLTTQGYGEEYLKVMTEDAERANRRVQVRRITPLVASADNA